MHHPENTGISWSSEESNHKSFHKKYNQLKFFTSVSVLTIACRDISMSAMMGSFFLSALTVLLICGPAACSNRRPLLGIQRRNIEEQVFSDLSENSTI